MDSEGPEPADRPTNIFTPPRVKRLRHSHRHTQSLGLLSPIPSRDSLRSDADASPSVLSQAPSRVATPSSGKRSTPATPRSKRTSLPAGSSPLPALLASLFHSSPAPKEENETAHIQHPQPVRPAPLSSPDRPQTPSRSEQLLRDALRRGSMSSTSRPPSRPSSRQSHSYFSSSHTAEKTVYGGDAEFSSNANHARSMTLSQLEGTGGRPAVCERDPAHEALRARLERMLSASAAASSASSGSGRASVHSGSSDQRASLSSTSSATPQPGESEAQREWSALLRGNAERGERERAWKAGVSADATAEPLPLPRITTATEDHRSTPRPRTPGQARSPATPTRSRHQETERTPRRRRTVDSVGENNNSTSPFHHHNHALSPHSPYSPLATDMTAPHRAASPSPLTTQRPRSPYTPQRVLTPTPGSPYSPTRALPHTPSRTVFHNGNESNVDLTRRNTSPALPVSPIRNTFGGSSTRAASPQRSPMTGSPQRSTFVRGSPVVGGSPTVRARAQTEPSPGTGSPINPMSLLLESDSERQRETRKRTAGQGHGRKSSAYAVLAALSASTVSPSQQGHAGYGGAHPAYPAIGNGHGYIYARAQLGVQHATTPGSTPPLSADVRDDSTSEEDADGEDSASGESGSAGRRPRKSSKLLTPPATPPRHSLVVVGDEHAIPDHAHEDLCGPIERPTFNARKASAQCRQLEGYVSFAAVEGLGEPPSPGPSLGEDGDDEGSPERRRKHVSLGAGIVGLWRGTFW
ncbi:hypothetical protein MKEN_00610800 [Mycena kentingensis (nom. inval.)]|nr:hypothetical protein MKEN_00610800 [Mycena kentingensis (nom. inval.)]